MSLSRFLFTDRARPIVEIGIGDSRLPSGTSRWDRAHWDRADDAHWAGNDPTWLDHTCDIISADIVGGRLRATDRFDVATCTLLVDNSSGWADPAPDPAAVLALRPGRQLRMGIDHETLGRIWRFWGVIDSLNPNYDPVQPDVAQIIAVDMLGDANRTKLLPTAPAPVENAAARVWRILARVPVLPTRVQLDSTSVQVRSDAMEGQVADLVHQAADSAGGSVFGDPAGMIRFRARDWQTYPPSEPPDATIGNVDPGTPGYWIPGTPQVDGWLTPTVGTVSTPDVAPSMALTSPFRMTFKVRPDFVANTVDKFLAGQWIGAATVQEWFLASRATGMVFGVYNSAGVRQDASVMTTAQQTAALPQGVDTYVRVVFIPASGATGYYSTDGSTWTAARTHPFVMTPRDSVVPLVVGAHIPAGPLWSNRIYWAQMERLDPEGNPTGVVWRFDANDYPGAGTSYVDPRGRTWTLTNAAAITPKVPAVPDEWVPPVPGDVCPTGWERPFARADIATRVIVGRADPPGTDPPTARMQFDDQPAQVRYGIEPFERTDLLTVTDADLTSLGQRWLVTRGERTAPRIRSVTFDAATADNALDLCTTVTPYKPSRYRCRLLLERGLVFDRQHYVTRTRHLITAEQWLVTVTMDIADTFAAPGGRWDRGRWDRATWAAQPVALSTPQPAPVPIGA